MYRLIKYQVDCDGHLGRRSEMTDTLDFGRDNLIIKKKKKKSYLSNCV